jgi:hypothetical protein
MRPLRESGAAASPLVAMNGNYPGAQGKSPRKITFN